MKTLKNIILILFLFTNSFLIAQEYDKRTPFSAVEYIDNHPYFNYNEEWVEIISIEGIPIKTYIEYSINENPTDWKKGFHRYLHYIMDDMGLIRGETIKVSFKQDGKLLTKDIALKIENRDLATDYYEKIISNNRIVRPLLTIQFPDSLLYLNTRLDGYEKIEKAWLSQEDALHGLEYLEWEIKNHYSYAKLKHFNYEIALDAIKSDLSDGISKRDFALQLKMFLANFGDGHTRVSFGDVINRKTEYKWLPFKIMKWEGKYFAINTQTKSFYNSEYPQVVSINGREIEEYYKIAQQLQAKSTAKFIERGTEKYMQITAFIMKMAGEDITQLVELSFKGKQGFIKEKLELKEYSRTKPKALYYHKDSIIDDNIGYIVFNKHMDSDSSFIAQLHSSMRKMENTKALIIDIRQNGGGSRAPLVALLPYFIKQPTVTNIARYRINASDNINPKNGYLPQRFSYPITYENYSEEEKQAILSFVKDFNPVIIPSDEEFSDYHYMVVSPTTESKTYYYDKDIIVLVDEGCFSASDIFAAGIQQGDNVRLLGNITGGGSGFSKRVYLPHSELKVKLSRMFSYQPNGSLYDGYGVVPDIMSDYTFEDKLGLSDSQLDRAILELNSQK